MSFAIESRMVEKMPHVISRERVLGAVIDALHLQGSIGIEAQYASITTGTQPRACVGSRHRCASPAGFHRH